MAPGERYHCYLSYITRENNVLVDTDTKEKVSKIGTLLREHDINPFFQGDLRGDIFFSMVNAIDSSGCVIIFLTEMYMNKVNTQGTTVQQEFSYIIDSFGLNKVILVVLEEKMINYDNWKGVFKFRMGKFTGIEMTKMEEIEAQIDVLVERVLEYQ